MSNKNTRSVTDTAKNIQGLRRHVSIIAATTVSVFALSAATNVAVAQEGGAERADGGLDVITVTARRRAEGLQETPISITALTGDQLTERNLTDLSQVGAYAPNVVINTSPSSSGAPNNIQVYIRGVGQSDFLFTTDPGVGIYIDGVYHPRTLGGVFDLLDLERVEVLRGPQGTLFGKNTIGGAISLISKKPTAETSCWAEVTVGRYNRLDARASFNFPVAENLFALVSASAKNRDGYFDRLDVDSGEVIDTAGDENQTSARLAFRWLASDNVTVDLSGDYSREREKGSPNTLLSVDEAAPLAELWNGLVAGPDDVLVSSALITGDPYSSYATGPNKTDLNAYGFSGTIDWELSEYLSVKTVTAYREMDARFGSDTDTGPMQFAETDQQQDQRQFSQEIQLSGVAFDDRLNWVGGFFYFDEFGRDVNEVRLASGLYDALEALPGTLDGSPLSAPTAPGGLGNPINIGLDLDFDIFNEIDIESYAAFGQGSLDVTDRLSLTGGVRYTNEKKDYTLEHLRVNAGVPIIALQTIGDEWDAVTPMGSIDFQATDTVLVYGGVSRGFKSGGFNGRPTVQASVEAFDPEFVTSYELGFKSDLFDRRLRLNIAGFYNDYTDIQLGSISADETGNLRLRIQNAGKADVKGFELEFEAAPTDGLSLNGSVGFVDFELTEVDPSLIEINVDTQQIKTPKWTAALGAQYTAEVGDDNTLTLRGDWTYQGDSFQDIQNTPLLVQEAYGIFNARLSFENVEHGWSVSVFGTNLADKVYFTNGYQTLGSFGTVNAVYARPREWGLSVKKTF